MSSVLAQWLLAALFGGMLIFSLLFAPLVFTQLPAETAGPFIRKVFPWYYLWVLTFALLAAIALYAAGHGGWPVALTAAIAVAAACARWPLMQRINALRDRHLAGDAAAGRSFDRLHRLSVVVNLAQMLTAAWVIWLVVASG